MVAVHYSICINMCIMNRRAKYITNKHTHRKCLIGACCAGTIYVKIRRTAKAPATSSAQDLESLLGSSGSSKADFRASLPLCLSTIGEYHRTSLCNRALITQAMAWPPYLYAAPLPTSSSSSTLAQPISQPATKS